MVMDGTVTRHDTEREGASDAHPTSHIPGHKIVFSYP